MDSQNISGVDSVPKNFTVNPTTPEEDHTAEKVEERPAAPPSEGPGQVIDTYA